MRFFNESTADWCRLLFASAFVFSVAILNTSCDPCGVVPIDKCKDGQVYGCTPCGDCEGNTPYQCTDGCRSDLPNEMKSRSSRCEGSDCDGRVYMCAEATSAVGDPCLKDEHCQYAPEGGTTPSLLCSFTGSTDDEAGHCIEDQSSTPLAFGKACDGNADCESNLCINEWEECGGTGGGTECTGESFCSEECTGLSEGDSCSGGNGVCAYWQDPAIDREICLPTCTIVDDCKALDAAWDACVDTTTQLGAMTCDMDPTL